ncbi:hypothetical protein [Gorillibacterium massiliense]|uniref:hypothetical protein n=1 Tax=Gorillibacterium massiliense TaxID=1280390 RepID=UPI0004B02910|nr:hypothetical protein [Gorillibacterium massiliense]
MTIEYVKYNPFRKKEFALKTVIENENGKVRVKKKSVNIEAEQFIRKISDNRQLLKNVYKKLVVCGAELHDNEIIFEYAQGITLQESILMSIESNDKKGFIDYLYEYKEVLTDHGEIQLKKTSDINDEFCAVFGVLSKEYTFEYLPVSNIDVSFDNLVVNDGKLTMIDYEWVFTFPIPFNYIVYRNIIAFYNKFNSKLNKNKFISVEEVFKLFDIYEDDIIIFSQMESNFQKYVHGNNSNIYNVHLKETYYLSDLLELRKREASNSIAQFFWDEGTGFNELNTINIDINISNRNEQSIEFFVDKVKLFRQNCFRIDICKVPCAIKIIGINVVSSDSNLELKIDNNNANIVDGDYYVFFHDDPQFIFNKLENTELQIDKIVLKVQFIDLNTFARESFIKIKNKEAELMVANNQLHDDYSKLAVYNNEISIVNNNLENVKNELTTINDELVHKNNELTITNDEIVYKNNELKITNDEIVSTLRVTTDAKNALEMELNNKIEELVKIYTSKSWRLIEYIRKIIHYRK